MIKRDSIMKRFLNISFLFISLFISTTQAQWQQIETPQTFINDIIKLDNNKMLLATSVGVYFSLDAGISWDSTSLTSDVKLIKKDNFNKIYCNSGNHIFYSSNSGENWLQCNDIHPEEPLITNFYINDSGYIFTIAGYCSPIFAHKTTNNGVSWQMLYEWYVVWYLLNNSFSIIENSYQSIFLSFHLRYDSYRLPKLLRKDLGSNWNELLTDRVVSNMYFYDSTMYLTTIENDFYPANGILVSNDNGNTYSTINNGLNNLNVKQLILENEVFVALTYGGIYKSLDRGNHWIRLDHSGLNSTINRIYYDDIGNLYACTENGLYIFSGVLPVELLNFSSTLGSGIITLNWSTATELNNQGFEIQRKTKNAEWVIIGFKEGNGTTSNQSEYSFADDISYLKDREIKYRLKQIDFNDSFTYSDEIKAFLNPIQFSLSQNYPNPFNPTTRISYQLPKESKVVLKVYDILGSEVATLVNENQEAGYKELNFDASSLSSGIYIYKIIANDFVSSKKMSVIK
jgi:photosystem II stability/assembly factor-like uncharacterized protein